MFKNMKRFISLALPVVAMSLTSCNNGPKTITYEQMRRFAIENYDQYALDTVPATFTTNFNTLMADIEVAYETPEGGSDSFDISFGLGGVHVILKDHYAISLSSIVIDTIERYYSDFVGLAISLKEEPPIQMDYQLLGNNCSKIDFTTSSKLAGSVLIKMLQLFAGTIDLISTATGFIPLENPQEQVTMFVWGMIYNIAETIAEEAVNPADPDNPTEEEQKDIEKRTKTYAAIALAVLDYLEFVVSNSSKSDGETFNTYITTDQFGFVNKLAFNFKSSFAISGLANIKQYSTDEPEEGDRPIAVLPYHYSITGEVDFDFNIECNY